jgi:hypothetical protein
MLKLYALVGMASALYAPRALLEAPALEAVDLRSAGAFVILAKAGISTVPSSVITGDIGVSPIAATAMTGFSLIADASNTFSTSTQVRLLTRGQLRARARVRTRRPRHPYPY